MNPEQKRSLDRRQWSEDTHNSLRPTPFGPLGISTEGESAKGKHLRPVLEGFLPRQTPKFDIDDHDLIVLSVEKACENMLCWVIGRDSAI